MSYGVYRPVVDSVPGERFCQNFEMVFFSLASRSRLGGLLQRVKPDPSGFFLSLLELKHE